MTRAQIKQKAKTDIKGQTFLLFVLIFLVNLPNEINGIISTSYNISNQFSNIQVSSFSVPSTILIIFAIIFLPLQLGLAKIFIDNSKEKKDINISSLIPYYKNLNQAFQFVIASILKYIYIVLGTICLIIPGIIMALRYAWLPYVFAEDPTLSYKEAMHKTKAMMKGHSGDLFVLYLSFLGWFILCGLTFGILSIYVAPYFTATLANFYNEIKFVDESTSDTENKENSNDKNSYVPYEMNENQNKQADKFDYTDNSFENKDFDDFEDNDKI